jgi:hypothetical protein
MVYFWQAYTRFLLHLQSMGSHWWCWDTLKSRVIEISDIPTSCLIYIAGSCSSVNHCPTSRNEQTRLKMNPCQFLVSKLWSIRTCILSHWCWPHVVMHCICYLVLRNISHICDSMYNSTLNIKRTWGLGGKENYLPRDWPHRNVYDDVWLIRQLTHGWARNVYFPREILDFYVGIRKKKQLSKGLHNACIRSNVFNKLDNFYQNDVAGRINYRMLFRPRVAVWNGAKEKLESFIVDSWYFVWWWDFEARAI